MKYKHFFFDLDGTVTRSRSLLSDSMRGILTALRQAGADVIIVSGAKVEQIRTQMDSFQCYYLGLNGNHAVDSTTGELLWERRLTDTERTRINEHIASIPRTWGVSDESDLVQDRGCQISYSLLGHNEVLELKEAFDPKGERRTSLLAAQPLISDSVEVKIGGTTCLDYIQKGMDKGLNVKTLIESKNWDPYECVYIGDALYKGGNDEAVIGVIDTHAVSNPTDTESYLKQALL